MKVLKKMFLILIGIMIIMSDLVIVNALDNNIDSKSDNSQQRSGGLISSSYEIIYCNLVSTTTDKTYLTSSWSKASSYTVNSTVTKSSSTTLSIGINSTLKDKLKSNYNISYGTSVSTSSSIGTILPADSTRNSKLVYSVQMKKYNIKVRITSKYYDTSPQGYYTLSNDYTGTISVPNKNETYIKVEYK